MSNEKSQKLTAFLLSAVLCAGVMTGCGGTSSGEVNPDPAPAPEVSAPVNREGEVNQQAYETERDDSGTRTMTFVIQNYGSGIDPAREINCAWNVSRYGVGECLFMFNNAMNVQNKLCDGAFNAEAAAKLLDDAGIVDTNGDGIRELDGQDISCITLQWVFAMAIAGILGASVRNAVIAVSLVSWTKYARLARSLVLKIRNRDYVAAAVVMGSKTPYILTGYMLPNVIPTLVITAATDIGGMMLELARLSFLGFGAKAPTPEWGLMLNAGRQFIQSAPWMMIYPGAAILVVVVVFNLLGDALRDILDPRQA